MCVFFFLVRIVVNCTSSSKLGLKLSQFNSIRFKSAALKTVSYTWIVVSHRNFFKSLLEKNVKAGRRTIRRDSRDIIDRLSPVPACSAISDIVSLYATILPIASNDMNVSRRENARADGLVPRPLRFWTQLITN